MTSLCAPRYVDEVLDVLYIAAVVAFFVIAWAFTKACDRM